MPNPWEELTSSSTRVSRRRSSGRGGTDSNNINANTFNPAANVPSSTHNQFSGKIVKTILEDGRDWLDSIDTQTGLFTTKLLDAYETS